MAAKPQLIDILTQNESISADHLDQAVRLQQERQIPLAEVLVWESLLDEEDIFFLLSRALGVPAIPEERLLHLTLSPEIRRRVPRAFARSQVLIPLDLDVNKGLLLVAMFDPSDSGGLEKLRATARVGEIRTYLARRSSILGALKTVYSDEDDFRDEDPEWLPAQGSPEARGAGALEAKVEIDPGLVEELAVLGTKSAEPLRSIRLPRPLVVRAADHDPGSAPPPPPRSRALLPEIPAPPPPRPPARSAAPPPAPPVLAPPRAPAAPPAPPVLAPPRAPAAPPAPPLLAPPRAPVAPPRPEALAADEAPGGSAGLGMTEEENTDVYRVFSKSGDLTAELEAPAELGFSASLENDHTPIMPLGTAESTPLPEMLAMEQADSLLRELLSSVGVLISMLEERIDPSGGSCREFGRTARLVARELGLDELSVASLALAAHLFALDLSLRRELGINATVDVTAAFAAHPSAPGGLGPSLRSLGARALGLEEGRVPPPGVAVIRLVGDYLELRAESDDSIPDLEKVARQLRARGGAPLLVDALIRALESFQTARVKLGPGGSA